MASSYVIWGNVYSAGCYRRITPECTVPVVRDFEKNLTWSHALMYPGGIFCETQNTYQ